MLTQSRKNVCSFDFAVEFPFCKLGLVFPDPRASQTCISSYPIYSGFRLMARTICVWTPWPSSLPLKTASEAHKVYISRLCSHPKPGPRADLEQLTKTYLKSLFPP